MTMAFQKKVLFFSLIDLYYCPFISEPLITTKGEDMKIRSVLSLVMGLALIAACGSSGTSSTATDYLTATKSVTPVFTTPTASISAPAKAATPTWGYRSYEIAVIFAENGDEFGVNNIYNNISTAQSAYTGFNDTPDLEEYAFDKSITAPFFGTELTYQYATNYSDSNSSSGGIAIKTEDGTVKMLVTRSSSSDHVERSALEASYKEDTKILTLDVVSFNDYTVEPYISGTGTNTGKFIMRLEVQGDGSTHTFDSLRLVKYNPGAGVGGADGYYINVVGKGVSQGAGAYILFRITDTGGSETAVTDKYFCLSAENLSAETTFTALSDDDVPGTNCAAYLDDVKAMTPFNVNTDLPSTAFDTGIGGNPKEFVMVNPIPTP